METHYERRKRQFTFVSIREQREQKYTAVGKAAELTVYMETEEIYCFWWAVWSEPKIPLQKILSKMQKT